MKPIIGLMAATKEGVIGHNQSLPWHYPDELSHFKQTTHNSTLVMGRKTYETVPKSFLSHRKILVLSRNPHLHLNDAQAFHRLSDCLAHVQQESAPVFMVGGAEMASLFLEHSLMTSFLLTEIHKSYTGDVVLNLNFFKTWTRIVIKKTAAYTIYRLVNPNPREF